MPNQFFSLSWYNPVADTFEAPAYAIHQISSGPFAGEFATTHKETIIHISDTVQEAIDYSHKHAMLRLSAFNVEMPNLLALANTLQGV